MITTLGVIDTLCAPDQKHRRFNARRRVGGEALVRRVVRRATDAERLSGVAVTITEDLVDELGRWVPSDVTVVPCRSANPIKRLVEAAATLDADAVVRVDLHSPFADPDLIDGLVAEAERQIDCDYVGYRSTSGHPTAMTQMGLFGEWCRVAALQALLADGQTLPDVGPETVTNCLLSHPELFQFRFIPVPEELDRDDLRLRLRDEEDWEAAEDIIEALDPEELDWHGITRLLEYTPALRARMRQRNAAETAGAPL